MKVLNWTAFVLTVVGALNWGLVGAVNVNLVSMLFGDMSSLSRIVYVLVGLAAVWMIVKKVMKNSGGASSAPVGGMPPMQ
ncbi:MAG: DUF378 domain-containing protein [bacterium]|nr:DUF378 domain-containing protein [bacterium]